MYNNKHHQFETQYNHKIFAHINGWNSNVFRYLEELKPKVVKFLDPNEDAVRRVRELIPDALIIYRRWTPDQPLGNNIDEAYQFGLSFAQEVLAPDVIRSGIVNLVEGYNERLGETAPAEEHQKFSQFMVGFQDGLQGSSVEPVAFNFGTGNMSAELLRQYYMDVLNRYTWLGFHEYDWPFLWRLHEQGLQDGNGGQWLALRYRRILSPLIAQFGKQWSVLISEFGMTQGVLGGQDVGFRYLQNTIPTPPWNTYPTPISAQDYWQSLLWYSDELMRDDYVAGACHFVTGSLPPWESFEMLNVITPILKNFQTELPENGGGVVNDLFVEDTRLDNDPSLAIVPRIQDFQQLLQYFNLAVDRTFGEDGVEAGQFYWRLVGFRLETGPATYRPQVLDGAGNPLANILVWRQWPGAPQPPGLPEPPYFSNGVAEFTKEDGTVGFGFSGDSIVDETGRGPDNIWPNIDPNPNETSRRGSDCAKGLGWIAGTEHLVPNPVFRVTQKGAEGGTPPPVGDVITIELRINDQTVYEQKYKVSLVPITE